MNKINLRLLVVAGMSMLTSCLYSTPEYAYLYNTAAQDVCQDEKMLWSYNGTLSSGIEHTAYSGDITFLTAGAYAISVVIPEADQGILGLYLNETFIAGTNYGSVNNFIHMEAIIEVSENDVLSVRALAEFTALSVTSAVYSAIKIHSIN